jgi:hypothetical protein
MKTYLEMADDYLLLRHARRLASLLSTIDDPDTRADLRERFEERAGIMEFDGNLQRDEAERLALHEIESAIGQLKGSR